MADTASSLLQEWYDWWENSDLNKMPGALHVRTALVLNNPGGTQLRCGCQDKESHE